MSAGLGTVRIAVWPVPVVSTTTAAGWPSKVPRSAVAVVYGSVVSADRQDRSPTSVPIGPMDGASAL